MKDRVHLYIAGRVQGVFYRAFTMEVANSLGLAGWARNLSDGRVEVIFEGSKDKIEIAIEKCYKGPPKSRVTNIDVRWEDRLDDFRSFSIRY